MSSFLPRLVDCITLVVLHVSGGWEIILVEQVTDLEGCTPACLLLPLVEITWTKTDSAAGTGVRNSSVITVLKN